MDSEVRNRKNLNKNKTILKKTIELIEENNEKCENKNERVQFLANDEPKKINKIKSEEKHSDENDYVCEDNKFVFKIEFDGMSIILFVIAAVTRLYKLTEPRNIVFDELHYGKYVSLYMKSIFFFDQHPPLGKQLIAGMAHLVGFNGNFTFPRIGSDYSENVPIFWLRFIPAICGSLLAPCAYKVLLQMKMNRWTAVLGGILIILDNALLTQSRFILMESMLILFSVLGLLFMLKSQNSSGFDWLINSVLSAVFFTFALSVKYVGFYACCLGFILLLRFLWKQLSNTTITNCQIVTEAIIKWTIFTIIPIIVYLGIFYVHLNVLNKAGPHDSVMTSAFQASLEGGLASITKGQPLKVVHGSQITLRHTHGRTCWLHSHAHVYPVRYPDKRGSSHQQQVSCYSFKDVNNWWIVKRPEIKDLVVGDEADPIKHDDIVQLVHGITSRALNSHDVAAPMSPQCQEVSCYIDYNVSMSAAILWKIDIINKDQEGPIWHAITSQVRLIHTKTGQALKFTGRQLPDWGFNQHEVAADRVVVQPDTVWNVEEHRYTKSDDQKERERQLINAEMIPTGPTTLSFWDKFIELQSKMLWTTDLLQSHMYSSEPLEWPLMSKGIAYWVDKSSNAQIHLLGNIIIWYSGTISLVVYSLILIFYLLRRRRECFDLNEFQWEKFKSIGEIFLTGYLMHFLPYFFVERTLFLHNYLPAYIFKIFLLACLIEHFYFVFKNLFKSKILLVLFKILVFVWISSVLIVFMKFLVVSYGTVKLTPENVMSLRWKDTWDFILHKKIT